MRRQVSLLAVVLAMFTAPEAFASPAPGQEASKAPRQTQADDYTRYELLAPDTAAFRIVYDVTATTPGARFFFNSIRKGSEGSGIAVHDLFSGSALRFEVVGGDQARLGGLPNADVEGQYIKVHLPRLVPDEGEVRLRIEKTYKDPASYFRDGDTIVFSRSLGINRNAIVLPAGYELVACNVPAQVLSEQDGRIVVSFINISPAAAPLRLRARPLARRTTGKADREEPR
jgi:hypothetical protein